MVLCDLTDGVNRSPPIFRKASIETQLNRASQAAAVFGLIGASQPIERAETDDVTRVASIFKILLQSEDPDTLSIEFFLHFPNVDSMKL